MGKMWSLVKVGGVFISSHEHTTLLVKGILGRVLVDGIRHPTWKAYSMEFKYSFMARCVDVTVYQLLSWLPIVLKVEDCGKGLRPHQILAQPSTRLRSP